MGVKQPDRPTHGDNSPNNGQSADGESELLLDLIGITKAYRMGPRELPALQGIDLRVSRGEYVAIMGPSGSGKSTLLNILGCLDRPTSGHYLLNGQDAGDLDEVELAEIRQREIGFVFQTFHLVPRLTAKGNVELPMVFAGLPRAERRERVQIALRSVGLEERADHRPDQLSGGERQRVAIARATVMGPNVLLADEPTGNLDSNSGKQVMEMLETMNREGITLILVSHDPAIAGRANRVLILTDGRIVHRVPGGQISGIADFFEQHRTAK